MNDQERDSHPAFVMIDTDLWSTFLLWIEGQGLVLTDITYARVGEGLDVYRLHRNGFPDPDRPTDPHIQGRWS